MQPDAIQIQEYIILPVAVICGTSTQTNFKLSNFSFWDLITSVSSNRVFCPLLGHDSYIILRNGIDLPSLSHQLGPMLDKVFDYFLSNRTSVYVAPAPNIYYDRLKIARTHWRDTRRPPAPHAAKQPSPAAQGCRHARKWNTYRQLFESLCFVCIAKSNFPKIYFDLVFP